MNNLGQNSNLATQKSTFLLPKPRFFVLKASH